jgi:hypothetical protein
MSIQENGEATVICYTSDNEFFQGRTETFSLTRFFLEVTQHIPPRGLQYIRRYGLFASRTKGKWLDMPHVARLAPADPCRDHRAGRGQKDLAASCENRSAAPGVGSKLRVVAISVSLPTPGDEYVSAAFLGLPKSHVSRFEYSTWSPGG